MRVRAAVVGGVSVFACALVWSTSGSADKASTVCGPEHSETLAKDRAARVYLQGGNVYGCARAGDHNYRLGSASNSMSEGRAGPVALAGVDVAYGLTYYGVDTISADVIVQSLTNGAVLRRVDSWSGSVAPEYFQTVDDIVVKRDGSVAWIATEGSIISSNTTSTEVEKSDKSSSHALLGKSTRIRKHSLRLHRSEVTWLVGSNQKDAAALH
jgi:hypothetical protein